MSHPSIRASALVLFASVLTGCSLTPSQDDPVTIRMNDMDARITKIDRVMSNQSLVDLSQRLEALEAESRRLRGEVEVLSNGSDGLRKQQRDLYADLERRIGALEGSGPRAPTTQAGVLEPSFPSVANTGSATAVLDSGAGAASAPAAGVANAEQRAYDVAFDALKRGQYDVATVQFQQFLTSYPRSALAENAQYWLGEAHYVTRNYEAAATAFTRVGQQWPGSRKAADAHVKLGFAQYELKRYADAKQTLAQVVARYPDTEAAKLAQDRLKRMIAEQR